MITKEQQETLADIFANSERPDKMSIEFDAASRDITIRYENLDWQWFAELRAEADPGTTVLRPPNPAPE